MSHITHFAVLFFSTKLSDLERRYTSDWLIDWVFFNVANNFCFFFYWTNKLSNVGLALIARPPNLRAKDDWKQFLSSFSFSFSFAFLSTFYLLYS